jgi:hypothetical protein
MENLFDNLPEQEQGMAVTKSAKLQSKKQKDFFRQTANVEKIKAKIAEKKEHLNTLQIYYAKEIVPTAGIMGRAGLNLAKAIGNSARMHKFTQVQFNKTKEVILALCFEAFTKFEPEKEDIEFFDKWSPETFESLNNAQMEETKDHLKQMIHDDLGVDIDFSDLDDSPDSFIKFQQRLEEKMKENISQQSEGKKTKRQLQAEAKQKLAEELKNKSLRSIYVSLAKLLHPDLEENEDLKAEKEQIMKTLTAAYEAKDLPTLLKLELQWVHKQAEDLDKVSDEKLDLFISMLKEQIKELKFEYVMLPQHPKYEDVSMYANHFTSSAIRELNEQRITIENQIKEFNDLTQSCGNPSAKKKIIQFVNSYYEEMIEDDLFNFDDFDFDDFIKTNFS